MPCGLITVVIRKFVIFFRDSNLESKKYSPTIKMTKISINKTCHSFDHISFKFKPLQKVISGYHSWLNYLIAVCSSNPGSIIVIFVSSSEYLIRIYAVKQLKLYIYFWFNYLKRIISIAKSSLVCLTTFLIFEVVIAAFSFTRLTLVRWHISNGRQLLILLTIHLIFVHFAVEMITSTYMIFSYGQYNDLVLFFDHFSIHKCHFSVITFGKFSGHTETSFAFLHGKFSINYTLIPFN